MSVTVRGENIQPELLTKSQPGSRYRVFTLLHSCIIFLTFLLHSSAARSYPSLSSSLDRSEMVGGKTGSNGKIANALLNLLLLNRFHIRFMDCCGGSLSFFFFLLASLELAGAGIFPLFRR